MMSPYFLKLNLVQMPRHQHQRKDSRLVCHECCFSDDCNSDCFESESDAELSSQCKINSPSRKHASKISTLRRSSLFQLNNIKKRCTLQ